MTTEYPSPPFINAAPLGSSSLEYTSFVSSIQSAFLLWFSLYPSTSGKWSEGFQKPPRTFASGVEEVPRAKKAKVSDTATEESSVSTRVRFLHCLLTSCSSLV